MRQLKRGCDEGHWHAHTKGLPWGISEVVGTVQQVHCSRRRLLRRRLEFHMCTINKSAHTKKVWKLIVCTAYVYLFNPSATNKIQSNFFNRMQLVRTHRLPTPRLQIEYVPWTIFKGVSPPPYTQKNASDREAPVLKISGVWSIALIPITIWSIRPGVIVPIMC